LALASERFSARNAQIKLALELQLRSFEQALRGTVGLFAVKGHVDRRMWRTYTQVLDLPRYLPGIQAIGYARWISHEQKDLLEMEVRSDGREGFAVWPSGTRSHYAPAILI